MGVYKKLFRYVPNEKYIGYMSILLSSISAFLVVYGYYYIYLFLKEAVVKGNYENAGYYSTRIVICLTISAVMYLVSGIVSHKLAFRLETNLRKRGIEGLTDLAVKSIESGDKDFTLEKVLASLDTATPGSKWNGSLMKDNNGVEVKNSFFVYQDTYVFGKGYMGVTSVEVPEKYGKISGNK